MCIAISGAHFSGKSTLIAALLQQLPNYTSVEESSSFEEPVDSDEWIEMMQEAIERLDLIVFVPVEKRIPVPASEDLRLRANVDNLLQEMILEDSLGMLEHVETLEVMGGVSKREEMIKSKIYSSI